MKYIPNIISIGFLFLIAMLLIACCSSCESMAQKSQAWQASSAGFATAVAPAHQAETARRAAQ